MARGRKKNKADTYSPFLSGWDPLDCLFDAFLLEPHGAVLGGTTPEPQPEPQPPHHQPTGTSPETLEWLRRCWEESSERRLQQQWTPRPELGWCEWCPQPRHREKDCAHTGPDYCCCCVFPEEEDELRGLLGDIAAEDGGAASGDGLPPAPPLGSAPNAGLGADRALLGSLPGPLPDSAPTPLMVSSAAGSESWWGESGDVRSGVGAEEEPAADMDRSGEDDAPVPTCGEDGRLDPQPQVPASFPARLDSPEPAATEVGLDAAVDPAPAGPNLICAAAPEATRKEGSVPIRAAAPLATRDSGQVSSGGPMKNPEASTPAAPSSVLECGPGPDSAAAPPAAEESGPKIFAGVPPAGQPDSLQGPLLWAAHVPPHSSSQPSALTPPPAPRTNGPRTVASAAKGGVNILPGPLLEKGGQKTELSPPLSSLRLSVFAPDLRNRLVFDPGGWKLRWGECDVRRRGNRGSAPR